LIREITVLLKKEFTIEYRQKYALGSVLLYVFATVYIVYTAIARFPDEIWYAQYWIIILFAAINAVLKSFVQESPARQLYLYSMVSPYSVILSKIIYNFIVLLTICFLCYGAMILFVGSPVKDTVLFLISILLGASGLGTALTFVASVAAKGSNQSTLMAILGFPVIIPVLLIVLKVSAQATGLIADDQILSDIQILLGLNILMVALSIFLFPYIWRD